MSDWNELKRPFSEALIVAYNRERLATVLTHHADRRLDRITSTDKGFDVIVDHVIDDAERNGWLEDLAQGALTQNETNPSLQELVPRILAGIKAEGKSYYQRDRSSEAIEPSRRLDPTIEPPTILIPAGPFLMGSKPRKDVPEYETPQHEVTLPSFRIGRFPVTHEQYERFIRENKHINDPSNAGWFNRKPPDILKPHPLFGIGWAEAMEYCAWLSVKAGLSYRLPSEAEWEKAASWVPAADGRTGKKRRYPWGNKWLDGRCNVGGAGTTTDSAYPDGASDYGVLDMLGNVQEWTRSAWGNDTSQPEFGYKYRADEDGRELACVEDLPPLFRVIHRGGSYKSKPGDVNNTRRGHSATNNRIGWLGFRVVQRIE